MPIRLFFLDCRLGGRLVDHPHGGTVRVLWGAMKQHVVPQAHLRDIGTRSVIRPLIIVMTGAAHV